jgi:signal recognition particle receptor subunit beta
MGTDEQDFVVAVSSRQFGLYILRPFAVHLVDLPGHPKPRFSTRQE